MPPLTIVTCSIENNNIFSRFQNGKEVYSGIKNEVPSLINEIEKFGSLAWTPIASTHCLPKNLHNLVEESTFTRLKNCRENLLNVAPGVVLSLG